MHRTTRFGMLLTLMLLLSLGGPNLLAQVSGAQAGASSTPKP